MFIFVCQKHLSVQENFLTINKARVSDRNLVCPFRFYLAFWLHLSHMSRTLGSSHKQNVFQNNERPCAQC
jgi:hypothetical protein